MSQPIEHYLGKIASATNIEADDNFYFEGTCNPKVKQKSTELKTEYYSDDEKTDDQPYEKVKIDSILNMKLHKMAIKEAYLKKQLFLKRLCTLFVKQIFLPTPGLGLSAYKMKNWRDVSCSLFHVVRFNGRCGEGAQKTFEYAIC